MVLEDGPHLEAGGAKLEGHEGVGGHLARQGVHGEDQGDEVAPDGVAHGKGGRDQAHGDQERHRRVSRITGKQITVFR